jgi:hypothetical protein
MRSLSALSAGVVVDVLMCWVVVGGGAVAVGDFHGLVGAGFVRVFLVYAERLLGGVLDATHSPPGNQTQTKYGHAAWLNVPYASGNLTAVVSFKRSWRTNRSTCRCKTRDGTRNGMEWKIAV